MDTEEQYDWDMLEAGEEWHESEIRSIIAHVKANKFLIDKTQKDFSNKEKKDNTWKIIAVLLNRTEIEVQKKWKSLRTVFSRKLAQLKQKMPSGSGVNEKENLRIDWEYWGDMQFLIPHMRHKSNRTSNFHKTSLPVSSKSSGFLASSKNGQSILKLDEGTHEDTVECIEIESSPLQNANLIFSNTSNFTQFSAETQIREESTLLSSNDSSSEYLSTSNSNQEISMSTNKTERKKHSFNVKCKRKVPTPDEFHLKKKKEIESCSTRVSEASQHMKDTLNAITQSLKEPSGNDDLQYFTCLLPIFRKLNDDQKTECLKILLNVMIDFGNKNKQ
ncbi:hypothetical protein ALC62_14799 [Cyphomyrmex costatus]|uniref:MADF domain-containing protein n=1 Tax=Cyphomyrmex costatus TaxID=456900 RepID=A0A151I8T0_9HYME|nr:hypothetical protein ALC62_14799 [Cyphomyrmex costatus]